MDLDNEELFFTKNKKIFANAFDDLEIMLIGLYSQCKENDELESLANYIETYVKIYKDKRQKELERGK